MHTIRVNTWIKQLEPLDAVILVVRRFRTAKETEVRGGRNPYHLRHRAQMPSDRWIPFLSRGRVIELVLAISNGEESKNWNEDVQQHDG